MDIARSRHVDDPEYEIADEMQSKARQLGAEFARSKAAPTGSAADPPRHARRETTSYPPRPSTITLTRAQNRSHSVSFADSNVKSGDSATR